MKKHALKRRWGITLLAFLVSACGGDSSGPSQGLAPDVAGRFTDPWFWTIELRRVSDGQATALRCAGSLWISQNTGASAIGQLTGSAVVDEPCRPFSFDLTGLALSVPFLFAHTNLTTRQHLNALPPYRSVSLTGGPGPRQRSDDRKAHRRS